MFGWLHTMILGTAVLASAGADVLPQGRSEALPKELDGVGITEHLGQNLPLALAFTDESGKSVTLGDFFGHGKPVILTMNYSDCPMLCSLQLDGFTQSLRDLQWNIGQEFDVITVSINPKESSERAKQTQDKYLQQYGRQVSNAGGRGWHFLTGSEENIRQLAETVGFQFKFLDKEQEYAHAAAIYIAAPTGKLSRYLYGVMYDSRTLRLSLVEASEGKIGSPLDQVLLFCFHYDAEKGRYAPLARDVMRWAGVVTVLVLAAVLGRFWARESRKRNLVDSDFNAKV